MKTVDKKMKKRKRENRFPTDIRTMGKMYELLCKGVASVKNLIFKFTTSMGALKFKRLLSLRTQKFKNMWAKAKVKLLVCN